MRVCVEGRRVGGCGGEGGDNARGKMRKKGVWEGVGEPELRHHFRRGRLGPRGITQGGWGSGGGTEEEWEVAAKKNFLWSCLETPRLK